MGEKKPRGRPKIVRLLLPVLLIGGLVAYLRLTRPPLDRITVTGVVDATQVDVSSKLAGRLVEVRVDEGSPVSAGEVLARIDDPQLRDQVAAARATLAMMRTHTPQAQVSLALQQEETQTQVDQAAGAVASADARLAHEYVIAYVGETDVDRIHRGQSARIQVYGLSTPVTGHVIRIEPAGAFATERTQSIAARDIKAFEVKVIFDQPPPTLKPGMTADVTLPVGTAGKT